MSTDSDAADASDRSDTRLSGLFSDDGSAVK